MNGDGVEVRAVLDVAQALDVRPAVTVLAACFPTFTMLATGIQGTTMRESHVVLGELGQREVVYATESNL